MKRAIKHVLFCQLLGSSVVEYTDATFFHQSYIHIIHLYSICHWFCFVFLILYMNIIYMYNAGKVYTCIIWKCATASDIGSSTVSFCTCCEKIQHRQSMDFLNIKQPVSDREWLTLSISIQCYSIRPLFSWDGIYIDFVVIESLIRVSVLVIVLFTDNRSKMS